MALGLQDFQRVTRAKYILEFLAQYPDEFIAGFMEPGENVGVTYDGDVNSPRSQAYDVGRTLAEQEGYA